jgi:hypothetical protein
MPSRGSRAHERRGTVAHDANPIAIRGLIEAHGERREVRSPELDMFASLLM